MRFYFGFSKRIPLKFIIGGLIALATLLFGVLGVHADTIGIPSSIVYEAGGNQVSANVQDSGQGYYSFSISNLGMNSKNFIYTFNANSSLCPSQKAKFTFNFNFNDENNQPDEHLYIESLKYYDNQIISGSLTGSGYKTLTINTLDLTKSFSFIINETYGDKLIWSAFSPASYECISSESEIIIDNATQNTQDIIDNQNQNTQDIIDNQNANNQALIDSNKVCTTYDKGSISINGYLGSIGQIVNDNNYGISNYIKVDSKSEIKSTQILNSNIRYCLYDDSKTMIDCPASSSLVLNQNISIPINASFIRFSIQKSTNKPQFQICVNGSQAINDSLTDDNVSGSISNASIGFSNADVSEPIGLTSIITSPIRLLQKLLDGGTCDAYSFNITMNNQSKNVSLPSGCILWDNVPGTIIALYHVTIFGLLGYRILIDMVHFVNNLRDPDKKNDYTLDL